jgi:hypothetical protein
VGWVTTHISEIQSSTESWNSVHTHLPRIRQTPGATKGLSNVDFSEHLSTHPDRRLSKPEQALGNMAPLDLLDTDFGAREVENLLRTLAYDHFV